MAADSKQLMEKRTRRDAPQGGVVVISSILLIAEEPEMPP